MKLPFPLKVICVLSFIALGFGFLTSCSNSSPSGAADLDMASMEDMPHEVRSAPSIVQQAYQFAFANPDVLQQIPCYCGCGEIGHTSNYACYVSDVGSDGNITYDAHALGCSICVDITQDTMRLLNQGKSPVEIRSFIDQTYSQYGPSNMP
jgi:hypothetical protein